MSGFDPTTITIIGNGLRAAAAEMGVNLVRSAFSTVVREARDCSTALLDADGQVVAQAEMIPMQTAAISMSFKAARARLGFAELRAGTALIMNDPYCGGQHLNDIILFTPIRVDGTLLGYAGSTAHHLDIGGGAAGVNTRATDLIQEGLVIPPLVIDVDRDWNAGLFEQMLRANIRTPEIGVGDLNAQFAANFVGAERVSELAGRHGIEVLTQAMKAVQDYSERRLRCAIAALPAGVYRGQARLDRDVFDDRPIDICVSVQVTGSDLLLDFDGTAKQVRGMFNCPLSSTHAAVHAAIRSVLGDKDIPSNDGCNRPITLRIPTGTILNPRPPAPVRARMTSAYRAFDAVHAALAGALPDRVPAPGFNTTTAMYISQLRADGSYRVFVDILGGGYGAAPGYDGADAVDNILSSCRNTPIEAIEKHHPHLRVGAYALVADSGGAGRWRGGLGMERRFEVLEPGVSINIYADHFRFVPEGRAGGGPALGGSLTVLRRGEAISLPATAAMDLEPGDVVVLRAGGGGGFGDPKERLPDLLAQDLADGRISAEAARAVYGRAQ